MFAYVFLYSPSKLRVDGEHPLVRFESRIPYHQATIAIDPGAEKVVDRGIYAIWSDGNEVGPAVQLVDSRFAVDYDLFLVNDKDGWPSLIDPRTSYDPAMRERVRAAFPSVTDEALRNFFIDRRFREA